MSYSSGSLQGLGVLERDVNDEVVSWWFPAFDAALDSTLRYRVGLVDPQQGTSGGGGGGGGAASAGSTPPLSPSNSTVSSFTPFFSTSSFSPPPSFRYSRLSSSPAGVWHYSLTTAVDASNVASLSPVRAASIVLLSSTYDIVKARHFLHSLAKVHHTLPPTPLP
jgi:hypothetical protein